MYLIFDTETTGLPASWNAPVSDVDNWPRVVQLAWEAFDTRGRKTESWSSVIRPSGFEIPRDAGDGDLKDGSAVARKYSAGSFNDVMTQTYWEVGRRIVAPEQQRKKRISASSTRADFGLSIIVAARGNAEALPWQLARRCAQTV
jgi:hypothetical protein